MPTPPPTLAEYRARPAAVIHGGQRRSGARISVVTIVRNGAATIEETIQSVLAQTGEPVEHVIVDGGSTDGTLDILRRYDDRLGPWISEPDRGISDALNKGLALASGEIVSLLNADDAYVPGAVTASLAQLDAHPEAGFSFGDCVFIDEGNQEAFAVRGDADYARTIARRMPSVNFPTVFVRRAVYEQHGLFRLGYRIALDYDFLLRLHRAGVRGVRVPQVIARMRLGGVSNRLVMLSYREALQVALEHGQSRMPAVGAYVISTAGHLVKRGLLRVGADGLVRRLARLRFNTLQR
jgi:GT2 family glycosyltransferase